MLLRSPGFSLIVIATMALGIGATTAIYSVIDATLLHFLSYPNPSKLVRIDANFPGVGAHDVGLIADARTESLADAAIPQVYFDIYQRPAKFLAFYLRGQVDPAAISAQVRTQIQSVDAKLPVFHAETLDDVLSSSLSVRRFSMEMVALFGATALLLAGLGIYGTISFLVNEQSREIAIRLALGAPRRNILSMVLRQGLGLAAAGAGVGLVGALIVSHLMAGLLYGVSTYDLFTLAGVTLVLTAVAIAASYIPALRAMRLDPIATLHSE
jgi:ABC-type antimicrobial peptide transport system permease subunit